MCCQALTFARPIPPIKIVLNLDRVYFIRTQYPRHGDRGRRLFVVYAAGFGGVFLWHVLVDEVPVVGFAGHCGLGPAAPLAQCGRYRNGYVAAIAHQPRRRRALNWDLLCVLSFIQPLSAF